MEYTLDQQLFLLDAEMKHWFLCYMTSRGNMRKMYEYFNSEEDRRKNYMDFKVNQK